MAFSMDVLKSPFSRFSASFLQLISEDVSDSSSIWDKPMNVKFKLSLHMCLSHVAKVLHN